MKHSKNVLWGLVLVAVGLLLGLNTLGFTRLDITLIDGWWTLFIIVPCLIGLFTERKKSEILSAWESELRCF